MPAEPQTSPLSASPPSHSSRRPPFPYRPEDSPIHALAFSLSRRPPGWRLLAGERLRALNGVSLGRIGDLSIGAAAGRALGKKGLADAYEHLLRFCLEAMESREAAGLTSEWTSLDRVEEIIREAVADGFAPRSTPELFAQIRGEVRSQAGHAADRSPELDKVLGRIQALRQKTVEQGCTEEEALAAATKVAELLDSYGLSLSEVQMRDQAAEGFGIDTGRKQRGPIDTCIPIVAEFCDCRIWREQQQDNSIRYVFFGMVADVTGARYLYDLVVRTFQDETNRFRRGDLYASHHSSQRRRATSSFQTGLADGIGNKLRALKRERTSAAEASGRDLVPLKDALLEDELEKMGFQFTTKTQKRRTVLREAYDAGQEAGQEFEWRQGVEQQGTAASAATPLAERPKNG